MNPAVQCLIFITSGSLLLLATIGIVEGENTFRSLQCVLRAILVWALLIAIVGLTGSRLAYLLYPLLILKVFDCSLRDALYWGAISIGIPPLLCICAAIIIHTMSSPWLL